MTDTESLTAALIFFAVLLIPLWRLIASRIYDFLMGFRPKDGKQ